MTTVGDTNTAISAITTVISDLTVQAGTPANLASASNLRAAQTSANIALLYIRDCSPLVVGF